MNIKAKGATNLTLTLTIRATFKTVDDVIEFLEQFKGCANYVSVKYVELSGFRVILTLKKECYVGGGLRVDRD